jgi:branched-chain amino acid transport system permease protein
VISQAVNLAAFTHADFWLGAGIVAGIYAIFTLGLQLNVGFTGIVNLGQAGFMAIGAYAMAILIVTYGWSPWVALPVATLIAMLAGVVVAMPSVRLRGDYLAIATIAAAGIVQSAAQNATTLTGGNNGLLGFDAAWQTLQIQMLGILTTVGLGDLDQIPLFAVTWLTFAVLLVIVKTLQHTPWGRVLRAIREDEDAAEALGKNAYAYKVQSLALAAGIGAIAGYLLAINITLIYPGTYSPDFTFIGYAILVLGGLGSYSGVALGSVLLWILLEAARFIDLPLSADKVAALRLLIVGLVLVLIMVFRPQGILGKREEMVLRG